MLVATPQCPAVCLDGTADKREDGNSGALEGATSVALAKGGVGVAADNAHTGGGAADGAPTGGGAVEGVVKDGGTALGGMATGGEEGATEGVAGDGMGTDVGVATVDSISLDSVGTPTEDVVASMQGMADVEGSMETTPTEPTDKSSAVSENTVQEVSESAVVSVTEQGLETAEAEPMQVSVLVCM